MAIGQYLHKSTLACSSFFFFFSWAPSTNKQTRTLLSWAGAPKRAAGPSRATTLEDDGPAHLETAAPPCAFLAHAQARRTSRPLRSPLTGRRAGPASRARATGASGRSPAAQQAQPHTPSEWNDAGSAQKKKKNLCAPLAWVHSAARKFTFLTISIVLAPPKVPKHIPGRFLAWDHV